MREGDPRLNLTNSRYRHVEIFLAQKTRIRQCAHSGLSRLGNFRICAAAPLHGKNIPGWQVLVSVVPRADAHEAAKTTTVSRGKQ
jgi:hypothetical protein